MIQLKCHVESNTFVHCRIPSAIYWILLDFWIITSPFDFIPPSFTFKFPPWKVPKKFTFKFPPSKVPNNQTGMGAMGRA